MNEKKLAFLPPSSTTENTGPNLIGNNILSSCSPAGQAVERIVAEVAGTGMPVLIVGESGTGKEVIARLIHQLSPRRDGVFVRCDCSSLGIEALSKLLCHQDANSHSADSRSGMTLFLDGINELRSSCQQRLLQSLSAETVGESGANFAVRMISSASNTLENEVKAGRFREDLYYRLNAISIQLPQLCERREDIPAFVNLFLTRYSRLFGRQKPSLNPSNLQALQEYSWPGNIRQLQNVVKRIVVLGNEELALAEVLSSRGNSQPQRKTTAKLSLKEAGRSAAREAENHLILETLDQTRWNRKRAARQLGISYKALLYKLKQIEVDHSSGVE